MIYSYITMFTIKIVKMKQSHLDPVGATNSAFRLGPHEPPSVHSLEDLNSVLHQEVTAAPWVLLVIQINIGKTFQDV